MLHTNLQAQKLTLSMVVGVGPRRYLLTAQRQAMPYAGPTSWMIQGVVVDGKEVLRLMVRCVRSVRRGRG